MNAYAQYMMDELVDDGSTTRSDAMSKAIIMSESQLR
jgi:hypothetical protein